MKDSDSSVERKSDLNVPSPVDENDMDSLPITPTVSHKNDDSSSSNSNGKHKGNLTKSSNSSGSLDSTDFTTPQSQSHAVVPTSSVRPIEVVVALFDYNYPSLKSTTDHRLSFQQGEVIYVLQKNNSGWWDGLIVDDNDNKVSRGWFPQNYSRPLRESYTNYFKKLGSSSKSSRRPSYTFMENSSLSSKHGPGYTMQCNSSTNKSKSRRGSSSIAYLRNNNNNSNNTQKLPLQTKFDDSVTVDPLQKSDIPHSRSRSNPSSQSNSISKGSIKNDSTAFTHYNILSLEEVEMIINSIHSPITPTWTPIPVYSNSKIGDKLLYFNKELNIYCSELPLVSSTVGNIEKTPNNNNNNNVSSTQEAVFPLDDHLVDLTPIDLSSNAPSHHNSNKEMASPIKEEATNSNPSENESSKADEKDKTTEASANAPIPNPEEPQTFYRQAVLAKQDLFYHHSKDIGTWVELEELTIHYIKLTHDMFLKNDRLNFSKSYSMLSNLLIFTQLSCRLIQHQIKLKNCNKPIKKILKNLISALSKISINSTLYFDSMYQWNSAILPPDKRDTAIDRDHKNSNVTETAHIRNNFFSNNDMEGHGSDIIERNRNNNNGRNVSTSTTDTLTPNINPVTLRDAYELNQRVSSNATQRQSIGSFTEANNQTNEDGKKQLFTEQGREKTISIRKVFENIDFEFVKISKNIQSLHQILHSTILIGDLRMLPQCLPRFFKGSFNGGSWSNPFSTFFYQADRPSSLLSLSESTPSGQNRHNNSLTDSQISTSSVALPQKMANAIALAAGITVPITTKIDNIEETLLNGPLSKQISSFPSLSTSSRLPHSRGFSRLRSSKRKSKFPLNTETVMIMRKVADELTEKFNWDETNNTETDPRKRKVRNLELNSKTYEQMNQNTTIIEILENIDLTIFINLKKLIKSPPIVLDFESEEFLKHAMSSIAGVITEFYDIKQAFHDVLIKLIMSTQHTTLEDPYVFSSMRSNNSVGSQDPTILEKKSNSKKNKKLERKAQNLMDYLVKQDVETNNIEFMNIDNDFRVACERYVEIANLSCMIVEQLIEERENLLNYAARMMKNDLTAELLGGEQEKWYDYNSDIASDEEFANTRDDYDSDFSKQKESDSDTPWFLRSEHEDSLIYDSRGKIKGGTKEALIEHLTSHEVIDPSFNVTLLITFRSIITTKELLYALVYRYNSYPPEGLSYDEYNIWIEKKLSPIKSRVVNIMKTLFQQYWTSSYYEQGLLSIENFGKVAVSEKTPGADELYCRIQEIFIDNPNLDKSTGTEKCDVHSGKTVKSETRTENGNDDANKIVSSKTSVSSYFKAKKLKLLDIDPYIYATQLTILEHELYLRISIFECLDRAWGKKYCDMGGSENISKFIMNANTLTNFVSYNIVKQTDIKKRAQYIEFFITVAQHCKELNNFSSMTAIVSALYSSPIYRLKKTWNIIPEEIKQILNDLNDLMDSKRNFIKYRGLLRSVKDVACVPFFGVYLSDLTFTSAGNSDYLHNNKDIINFAKRSKIVDIIEEILSFKRVHYKIRRLEDIQAVIEGSMDEVPHIEIQYQLSLEIEPRITNNPNMNNPLDIMNVKIPGTDNNPTRDSNSNNSTTSTKEQKSNEGRQVSNSDYFENNGTFLRFGKKKQSSKLFK